MPCRLVNNALPAALLVLLAGCSSMGGSDKAYWAVGQEPFWQITVQDEVLVLRTPDQPVGDTIAVRHQPLPNGARWQGSHQSRPFSFEVRASPCRDVMSGALFTHTAEWQSGDLQAAGCAISGTQAPPWREGDAP